MRSVPDGATFASLRHGMPRDRRKLRVFDLADQLVLDVYHTTATFPREERYGLTNQLRRAAVSAASNIVEGCARRTTREYCSFLNIATGSTAEARYLLSVAARLGFLAGENHDALANRYTELMKGLQKMRTSLDNLP